MFAGVRGRGHRPARPGRGPGRRVGLAVVRGRSMQPTLRDGDRLLVVHGGCPKPGGLVVVRLPDGVVAVKRATRRDGDGWWVESDNRGVGVDSWRVGPVPDRDVVASVLLRLWPWRVSAARVSPPPHPGGPGSGL